jgi:hypothetical protein
MRVATARYVEKGPSYASSVQRYASLADGRPLPRWSWRTHAQLPEFALS